VNAGKDELSQIRQRIKQRWRRLPTEEIVEIEAEVLAAKLQEHYGWNREEAERQVREFRSRHEWH
jgi:hypothetical protein